MERSRLGQILEAERRSGKGTLGALASAIGGRTLEALDPRGRLFGRAGTRTNTFTQSLGRSVFGAGYSATRGGRFPAERIYGESSGIGGGASVAILNSMDSKLASIDAKMSIVAKSGIAQNKVARDINVMRQNIQVQTKAMTGSSRTKADMYFMNAKQRETEYERQFKKETMPVESARPESTKPKTSLMGLLGKGMGMLGTGLKAGAGIGAIYLGIQAISGLVKAFSFFSSLGNSIITRILDFVDIAKSWKEKWDNFNLNDYLKSISPDQLGTMLDSITNFIKNTSGGIGDTIRGLIEKLPADKVGTLIDAVVDSFLKTIQSLGSKLVDAVGTMDSGNILKLAAAGGIYSILFGGGGKVVGGVIGGLLRGVIPLLISNPVAVAGILSALGLYVGGEKVANKIVDLVSPDADMSPTYGSAASKLKYYGVDQSEVMNTLNTASPAAAQQYGNLIQQYNAEKDANKRKELMNKILQFTPENLRKDQFKSRYESLSSAGTIWNPNEGRWVESDMTKNNGTMTRLPQIGPVRQSNMSTNSLSPVKLDPFWENYSNIVGNLESGGDYTQPGGGANDAYLGKYQMGSLALKDAGLLKNGNVSWKDPNNWVSGYSLQRFLSDPNLQDQAFKTYTENNLKTLTRRGVITANTSQKDIQGILAASHLIGATGVANAYDRSIKNDTTLLTELKSNKDAFQTPASKYYSAFMEDIERPSLGPNIPNLLEESKHLAESGLQIVQNFYAQMEKKVEDTENALLSSFDSNTIKDIINPLLMRTTMSYL